MDYPEEVSFYSAVLIASVFFIFGFIVLVLVIFLFFQKKLYQKLYLQSLRENIQIQEQERKKIAEELHDEVSSILAAAKMKIAFLPEIWNNCLLRERTIDESKNLLDICLHQIRDLSHELSPTYLTTFGLEDSLKHFLENLKEQVHIDFTYNLQHNLSQEYQITFYRIILELVHNTLKHSQATQIFISLLEKNNTFFLKYSDNGKGLCRKDIENKKRFGLKNIENRVDALRGQLHFEDASYGFAIRIMIPNTSALK